MPLGTLCLACATRRKMIVLDAGEAALFPTATGWWRAHDLRGEMFGFPG